MLFSNEELALTEYQLPNEMVGKSLIFLQFTKDHARLFVSTYEGKNIILMMASKMLQV